MKTTLSILAVTAALAAPPAQANGADVAPGIFGGVVLGAILAQPRPPVVYAPVPAPYYPAPPVVYMPPPMPCYNRPVPVYDHWGRHIGWQEIRVCQ
jgi:hypothetical protein